MKYKKWTQSDLDFITNNQNVLSDRELAVKLSQIQSENITVDMIRRQRRKLKIKKQQGRRSKSVNIQETTS